MTAKKALKSIRDKGFLVTLDKDCFAITPSNLLTQSQRDFFKSHKAEIIEALRAELVVTVWTPAGNPMQVQATDAEHAAFLIRMNPKPDPATNTHPSK